MIMQNRCGVCQEILFFDHGMCLYKCVDKDVKYWKDRAERMEKKCDQDHTFYMKRNEYWSTREESMDKMRERVEELEAENEKLKHQLKFSGELLEAHKEMSELKARIEFERKM